MPKVGLTGLLRLYLIIINAAEQYGLDPEALLHAAGLDRERMEDPDTRVPVSTIWNLWRIIVERVQEPDLGVNLGRRASAKDFGLVGYILVHSRTLGDALRRMARYAHILTQAIEITLREDENSVEVVIAGDPRLDALRHPVDARLASLVAVARELTGTEISPARVHFPYPRPVRLGEHQGFFRCPLEFDRDEAAVVFHAADAQRSLENADETLVGYLDQLADDVLEALARPGSFVDEVRRAIWLELSDGSPSLKLAASRLGVSVRTLQRRLREEDTSFAEVLDEFRHDLAIHLLRDRRLAIYEVAFLLGYSDPSTFYRAFRRWWGTSPHDFRKMLDIGDDLTGTPTVS